MQNQKLTESNAGRQMHFLTALRRCVYTLGSLFLVVKETALKLSRLSGRADKGEQVNHCFAVNFQPTDASLGQVDTSTSLKGEHSGVRGLLVSLLQKLNVEKELLIDWQVSI